MDSESYRFPTPYDSKPTMDSSSAPSECYARRVMELARLLE